jgi:hypothetical protein
VAKKLVRYGGDVMNVRAMDTKVHKPTAAVDSTCEHCEDVSVLVSANCVTI